MKHLIPGLLIITTDIFYFVAGSAYLTWRLCVRQSHERYLAKGTAWTMNLLAPLCLLAAEIQRLSVASLGLEADMNNVLYVAMLLGASAFFLSTLYRDKDDDPYRDSLGKFKKKTDSLLAWRPPRLATRPTT